MPGQLLRNFCILNFRSAPGDGQLQPEWGGSPGPARGGTRYEPLRKVELTWADLGGPQIYDLSVYLFAAGTKNPKYPRAGLGSGLQG